jgi:hypothetical protein
MRRKTTGWGGTRGQQVLGAGGQHAGGVGGHEGLLQRGAQVHWVLERQQVLQDAHLRRLVRRKRLLGLR